MDEIYLPNLPDTNYILNPPKTIFDFPVAEIPYLDPVLLPSLQGIKQEVIPTNLPKNLENTSLETVATFNIPLFGEFPIPAPEVIASSVIAAGTASVVSVAGGIAMQAVVGQIKKIFKKIFTKVLKKEVKDLQTKKD